MRFITLFFIILCLSLPGGAREGSVELSLPLHQGALRLNLEFEPLTHWRVQTGIHDNVYVQVQRSLTPQCHLLALYNTGVGTAWGIGGQRQISPMISLFMACYPLIYEDHGLQPARIQAGVYLTGDRSYIQLHLEPFGLGDPPRLIWSMGLEVEESTQAVMQYDFNESSISAGFRYRM